MDEHRVKVKRSGAYVNDTESAAPILKVAGTTREREQCASH